MTDTADATVSWIALTIGPPRQHNAVMICQVDTEDDAFTTIAAQLTARGFQRVTVDTVASAEWPRADTAALYLTARHLVSAVIGQISLTPAKLMPLTGQWIEAGQNQGHTAVLAVVRAGSLAVDRGHFTDGNAVTTALQDLADRRGLLAARVDLVTIPILTEGATTT